MNTKIKDEDISRVMSILGKKSYQKSPRTKEFYKKMQEKSVLARKRNKLK